MNQNRPQFSIILPTFNRRDLLERAVDSVLGQSESNWELLIIDDGSTDETTTYLAQLTDSRIRTFHQKRSERSTARNLGIEKSTGKYICFLDDDDSYLPHFLSTFQNWITSNQKINTSILRVGFSIIDHSTTRKGAMYDIQFHKNPVHFAAFNMCGVWSLCIPRNFLDQDQFPKDFPHWQDTHLILRLFSKYEVIQLQSYQYNYYIHDKMGSISQFQGTEIRKRTELSILAIKDIFERHQNEIAEFIPKYTEDFLIQQKIYRGLDLLRETDLKEDKSWLRSEIKFVKALWKSYIKYKFLNP